MMKIENMNDNSIKEMKNFQQKYKKSNIFLHKIALAFLCCLNFVLVIFIVLYKSKISNIKAKYDKNNIILSENKFSIINNENIIHKKLVNIFSYFNSFTYYFSYIFETSKEVNLMKNSIKSFYQEQNINLNPDNFTIHFKFQGITDGDYFDILYKKLNYCYNTFILIDAENKIKFGFFIQGAIIHESYYQYDDRENNCFLLFFQSGKMYKCNSDKTKLKINNDNKEILIIGENDIIIKDNFLEPGNHGIINFPFKSFENDINNEIDLNGEFKIKGIEIFVLDFYNN